MNVIAGTDCGFVNFAASQNVDREIVWAQVAAMAEGARASEQLGVCLARTLRSEV